MDENIQVTTEKDSAYEQEQLASLTRRELKELEEKEKTPLQKLMEVVIMVLPIVCGFIAIAEYLMIPDAKLNKNPMYYVYVLIVFIAIYACCGIAAGINKWKGNKVYYEKVRHVAPLCSAFFLLLTIYDYLTIKTGILTQPFVPCMNFIINGFIMDLPKLIECTVHTLKLLMIGYVIGVSLGLVTGVTCGYSKKVRYWINPIIKFLGPIPTSTWIPVIMVVSPSLYRGAIFIIALGSWFAVTVASITGIANVDPDFFDAAKTLGASKTQLVFRVAIPHAMPNILQGCTQAMSSSCVALMIAEMLGVKSGLGWYMTWQTGWASYDKVFAALFVICAIFTLVTKVLEKIKRHVLRWQNGVEK